MPSRHSGSSRGNHNSSSHNSKGSYEVDQEDLVEQVKSIVTLLYEVITTKPHEWETYVVSARSAMTALDHLHFFRDPSRYAEQVWIIQGLQDFAYHNADNGCIRDIAEHCQAFWLRVLRNYPESVDALAGLGKNWLQRSQETLVRIQNAEGSDSSSSGDVSLTTALKDFGSYCILADPRRQGALYVEARGYLQPSVDFYVRAVRAADNLVVTNGDLFSQAAESQMSLGNVTASPANERLFTEAVRYLRRAESIPGYTLSVYMQQYLEDYGRYVS
ncbi:hypothetical protein BJ878DRAFT_412527 [Calycina marina]|uniref:Uncharacterized protein n=1 Tax=Calycina marina TaxID=1763456 RepID=A0A9P7ZBU6_9HELO|nr:hypothetical protein BJ878DRAFT_412527 [Calycina marina]